MGHYVKALPWKKSEPKWKVQFISYKNEHIKSLQNSTAIKAKKSWDIPKERWKSLGFYKLMTVQEAKARAKQLNIQEHFKTQEERLKIIKDKNIEFSNRFYSKLPDEFVQEFEKRFVSRTYLSEDHLYNRNRAQCRWTAAQKLIMSIDAEPTDWYYNTYDFYDYFKDQRLSVRYMNEIMKYANLWGYFICKKMGRPFMEVPRPGGYERRRILESYFEKNKNRNRASSPIHPEQLQKIEKKIKRDLYNWIFLTIWFGLRPKEVDLLHNSNHWRQEVLFNGRKVLWVYQTKVIALPEEDRWKPIPILYPEQEKAITILESNQFKRPLSKTIQFYFGKDVTLYGGRKAFTDLMLSKGNTLENISIWMGHSTIQRTWKSYKNRRKYHLQYST